MQLQEDFDAEMTDERAFGEMSERVEKETSIYCTNSARNFILWRMARPVWRWMGRR